MMSTENSPRYESAISDLLAAQCKSPQPHAIFAALDQVMGDEIGHILFTVLYQHQQPRELERLYTNQPEAYPVSGRKQIVPSAWTEQLLDRGEPYIGVDVNDIRAAFPDHKTIEELGCASVLNVPLIYDGAILGSVNLLHEEGFYKPHHIAPARLFASFALPAMVPAKPT